MRVALIGGGGFLGVHIARELVGAGHACRLVSSSLSPGTTDMDVEHIEARVSPGADMASALEDVDAVVDLTGPAVPSVVAESPTAAVSEAVGASLWIAEQALARGVKHHLYCSSGGTIYGDIEPGHVAHETDPPRPISMYGALKCATETLITTLLTGKSITNGILRIANPYGPWQDWRRKQGVVAALFRALWSGQAFYFIGDGGQVRDYVFAPDVARMIRLAVDDHLEGVVNVASGRGTSLCELAAAAEAVTGRRLNAKWQPAREYDVARVVLSNDLARRTGWVPIVGLEDGLAATWEWYRHAFEGGTDQVRSESP